MKSRCPDALPAPSPGRSHTSVRPGCKGQGRSPELQQRRHGPGKLGLLTSPPRPVWETQEAGGLSGTCCRLWSRIPANTCHQQDERPRLEHICPQL